MRIRLHGGFRERGRISIGVESQGTRLLLDTGIDSGIDSGGAGTGRYPAITPTELATVDAVLITHAHEDHVGALGWCLAHGCKGRILMTAEARRGASGIWRGYAEPDHRARAEAALIEEVDPKACLAIGGLTISMGRSGHIVGGVWLHVSDGTRSLLHCGDLVPASPVFAFDPPPPADVLIVDASYGEDAVPASQRAAEIVAWVGARKASVLPAPLAGRSLELLAILPPPVSIHAAMRPVLAAQISASSWLRVGARDTLAVRLAEAQDWVEAAPLPHCPLIVHDGMGLMGPSQAALAGARRAGTPVLFTGHVPAGSPGDALRRDGLADWIRLPTHPTLPETLDLVARCRPRLVLGHSAGPEVIDTLATHIPALKASASTGDNFDI